MSTSFQSSAAAPEPSAPRPGDLAAEDEPARLESREARTQRRSVGVLVGVVGALLLVLALVNTTGVARFALSNAFDAVQLPTVGLPGQPVVITCALALLGAAAGYLAGGRMRRWLPLLGTIAGIAVVLGFLTWAAAGRALPFPVSNQLNGTLTLATPLVLGALCGVLCERAGVVNVSIEGQFLTGAFAAALTGSIARGAGMPAAVAIVVALVAAILAGIAMSALLAVFAINFRVDQVVLGVVLNLLAAGITGFVFDQLVQENARAFNSPPIMSRLSIPLLSDIPFLGPVLFEQTPLVYIAIAAVIFVWFVVFRTKWGLRVRAVGEHPQAADTVGISVPAVRWSSVLLAGVFGGLGGAFFTIGSTGTFVKDMTVGNGFIALAALIMGRWHPIWAAVMALFFGFVTQLAVQVQTLGTPVPSQFLLLLPYVATIIAVAGLVGRVRAPAADGKPYEKSE
ncbi:simple sugar transport system permease protein [Naumannella cuiyingiana]|uniref:Simple sugar transport system permease protein n=1 Tax=Naumannella cuiyingiana TaxID=1347891 RepID=A0A7Z0D7F5_9ACTN|nr:simple sugar transport system permease protein [Naumannella cuiyingiana]